MAQSFGVFSSAHFAGVDQGVDFTGAGVIPALDNVQITSVRSVSIIEGGTYPVVGFKFLGGPYAGRYGYVMENFRPTVKVGQRLKKGQPIGVAAGSYPYIEVGFASGPSGSPVAPLYPDPHSPKPAGSAMWSYIQGIIGTGAAVKAPASSSSSSGGGNQGLIGKYLPGPVKDVLEFNPFGSNSPNQQLANAGAAAASGTVSVAEFLGKLADPAFWLRALEVIGGVILIVLGLYLLARQVGLSPDAPAVVRQAAGATPDPQQVAYDQGVAQGQAAAARREGRRAGAASISRSEDLRPRPVYSGRTRRRAAARGRAAQDEIPF